MDKLYELLDVYEEQIVGVHSVWDKINDKEVSWIISKKFWFIQWLVKENKIDLYKVRHHFCVDLYAIDYWDGDYMCPDYEIAIAVLSIQETPISFLVSILK